MRRYPTSVLLLPALALLGFAGLAEAGLCDDAYYLQEAVQTVKVGPHPDQMGNGAASTLGPDLGGIRIPLAAMEYSMIFSFEGKCSLAETKVNFLKKAKDKSNFTLEESSAYFANMYDTNVVALGIPFDFWFGFFQPKESLKSVLGHRKNDPDGRFTNFYATGIFTDSVKDATSGLWKVTNVYYPLIGPLDSIQLDSNIFDISGWRKIVFNANRKGRFESVFIKATYSNKMVTATSKKIFWDSHTPAFRIEAQSQGVRISISSHQSTIPALQIFDIFGRLQSLPNREGRDFKWNGKAANGFAAPPGTYFLRQGSMTLGRFIYRW